MGAEMTLLDREAELDVIAAALGAAASGRGAVVVVEGVPGIGKTSLLRAARAHAEAAGLRTLTASGGMLEGGFAFGVARQLLEGEVRGPGAVPLDGAAALAAPALGLAPEAGDAADPESPFPVVHGLFWLVADLAARGPLALVVDDLHWADEPSAQWLAYLARRIEGLPVALIAATRAVTRDAAGPHALDALLAMPETTLLTPRPLGDGAVAAALGAAYGHAPAPAFAAAVLEASGGNPLLVAELADALRERGVAADEASAATVEEVAPETVTRSVMLRIGARGADAVALARALAVVGEADDLALVAAVAECDAAAARAAHDALAAVHVLAPDGALRFAHPVVRQAIYHDMPAATRSDAHARAAVALAARGAAAESVAMHLAEAPPASLPEGAAVLRAAAANAAAGGAIAAAAAFLRRAVAEPLEDAERAVVLHDLGRAEMLSGAPEAVEHLRAALAAAAPADHAAVALDLARALARAMRADEAVAVIETAAASANGDGEHAALLDAELLLATMLTGRAPATQDRSALPGDTPARRALLAASAGSWFVRARPAEPAVTMALAGWADGALLGDRHPDSSMAANVAAALMFGERYDEGEAVVAAMTADARARGRIADYVTALAFGAFVAYQRGDVRRSVAAAHEALDLQADHDPSMFLPFTLAFLIEGLVETGEAGAAAAALAARGLDGPLPELYPFDVVRERRGRLWLAQGDVERALDDLTTAGARMAWFEAPLGGWRSSAAQALLRLGRTGEARALAEEELALARATGLNRMTGVALRAVALCADLVDEALLEESARLCAAAGAHLEEARALIDLGAAQRRRGARVAARDPLRRALDLTTRGGATSEASRARDELLAAGGRPRRAALTGAASLTPSERRIADLAASGATNPEIAQALFLTTRTVEMHLTATYRKLGITTRAQLPAALAG